MTAGAIMVSSRDWVWPAAGILIVLGALLIWAYWRAPGMCRWICPTLKVLGVAALAFCLLEPIISSQRARAGANLFAIVADNSQGLQLKDAGDDRTRGDRLRDRLQGQPGGWQERLADHFETRRYYFDARLQSTRDFSEMAFGGQASELAGALRNLKERYQGRPLAGVLLFTDGNATDARDLADVSGLPPLYPVVVGSDEPVPDLGLEQVHVAQTDFEDAPVSVQADVRAIGFAGENIVVRVLDEKGAVAGEQRLAVREREQQLSFRFQLRPEQTGLAAYRVTARAEAEVGAKDVGSTTREATLANNERVIVVNRGSGPYRVLYVAGRPNWEYKFLNRSLDPDRSLQLVGLVRVARREPKFNYIGRSGETSNPLYRGFGQQSPEEVEQYDQPVLVRLNTADQDELAGGFPLTPEALFKYHAVILDDLEAGFFKPDQAALLQKFVSERGGGFLMLGGMECFREGGYSRTPVGDMLPVYLEPAEAKSAGGEVKLGLTREGLLQTWARLRETEDQERARVGEMKPFQVLNRVSGVRPGATIIATASTAEGEAPGLVVQRYGRGRTAGLMIGDIWRWGMRNKESRKDMEKAWRQLLRWLVNDAPNRVELTVDEHPEGESGVRLDVRARDDAFQPLENAGVRLVVEPFALGGAVEAVTNATRLIAEPSASEPGLYQAGYVPKHAGGYKVTAYVTNSVGVGVGRAEAGWSTDPAGEEFRSLTPNVAFLEDLARRTGGQVIRGDRLAEFVRDLPRRSAPVMEPWVRPLWHTPALFLFALMCLVTEWGLRRWKGLP